MKMISTNHQNIVDVVGVRGDFLEGTNQNGTYLQDWIATEFKPYDPVELEACFCPACVARRESAKYVEQLKAEALKGKPGELKTPAVIKAAREMGLPVVELSFSELDEGAYVFDEINTPFVAIVGPTDSISEAVQTPGPDTPLETPEPRRLLTVDQAEILVGLIAEADSEVGLKNNCRAFDLVHAVMRLTEGSHNSGLSQ